MIPFISRHIPTVAQQATVAERYGELVCTDPIVFEPGRVADDVYHAIERLLNPERECPNADVEPLVAGVFPGWALLELLRDGWTVVEFVNEPSARQRGVFVCRGAFVHELVQPNAADPADLLKSTFLPRPIADQEDGPMLAGLR